MLSTIFFKNVGNDFVTVAPREIQIEIRRAATLRIEETLKIQVQLYWVYIGDFQAVSHHTIGTASPSDMIKALLHGKVHDVRSNEKIRAKAHPFNDVQLLLNATIGLFICRSIPIKHPFKGFLVQQLQVVIDIVHETAFAFHAIVQIDFTRIQDTLCIFNELRIKGKGGFQSLSRQENLIRCGTGGRLKARNQHIIVNGPHALMQLKIVFFCKSHGLHGDHLFKRLAVVHFGQLRKTNT